MFKQTAKLKKIACDGCDELTAKSVNLLKVKMGIPIGEFY